MTRCNAFAAALACAALLLGAPSHAAPPRTAAEAAARVAEVRAEVERRAPPRERRFAVARTLEALGPAALPALVALVDDGLAGASVASRATLLAAAFEALGALRDGRALPALVRWLDAPTGDAALATVAAEALGKCGGEAWLLAHATAGDRRDAAAIAGLGVVRTRVSAARLAARLGSARDAAEASALAHALGSVASSWAWQARPSAEGEGVRALASQALVLALASVAGDARADVTRALVVVAHPSAAPALSALASDAASPEVQRAARDALARLARP